LTRFLAYARTLWDWDEALFCLGMREFDVTRHQPHPPGFPLFIGLGKLFRLAIDSDFRALQAVNAIASILLFPAVFLYARKLGVRFSTAVIAGALFAFFPNVWFFGGTAFSDVPSIVLVLFAVVFFLDEARQPRKYFLGAFLLALAAGIRPQNILVGLFPGALATYRRSARDVAAAIVIGAVVSGIAYGAAIYATGGYDAYVRSNREHADYISRVDSFRSPERPALWRIWDRFFLKQYQFPPLSAVTSIFVVISIVGTIRGRDRAMLYNFLTFAPVAVMAWLMLDRYSINRFSIGYAPMFALFAADGIARAARGSEKREWAIGTALSVAFAVWAAPAFTAVRKEPAPTVQAVESLRRTIDPRRHTLYVGHSMTRFVDYLAPGLAYTRVLDDRALPLGDCRGCYLFSEVTQTKPRGRTFARERGRLWNIARRHYFEIFLAPIEHLPRFVSGWYEAERSGSDEWRWMAEQSLTELPPAPAEAVLRVVGYVPRELIGATLTVKLNGVILERVRVTREEVWRDYEVTALGDGPNRLEMTSDLMILRGGRPASLRVRFISLGQR
jgi:hypothetical protein